MAQVIHPANIESELERIWDSLQGTNKMRACLFNLIIYAKKCQRMEYLSAIAQKVIEKFPSRIIFVTYDEEGASEELKTAVSVMTADEGEYEIACDLIEIEAHKKGHSRVPFVVLPHILPDLPIYLVHADDPSVKNPIAEKLEHLADRIIFDSEATSNLPAFAQAALAHDENCKANIADLNWARTEGWRQLFASVFKSTEELDKLKGAKNIHIHYNRKTASHLCHTNIQSVYLATWIATQLAWTFKSINVKEKALTFHYESKGQPIQISLIPEHVEELSPGRILAIDIETNRAYHYTFRRNLECPHHVIIEKSTPESCSLPSNYVFDKDVSGQSLVKEICHKGTSVHYTRVLTFLATIQNGSLCHE